jgi:4-hydroxyphenylpyruvate dioxygenase
MRLGLAQICTLPATMADDLIAVQAAGSTILEAWLTKLEQSIAPDLAKDLADRGLSIPVAAGQGGILPGAEHHHDHFRRRLDLCQRLGIGTIVVAPDALPKATIADLARVAGSLARAGEWAAAFGVNVAVEFQSGNPLLSTLETAALLVEQVGMPNVGICLDAFHYSIGPSKPADLNLLSADNLFHVQLCDVAGVPREYAKDADRVFPGEGDFDLRPIMTRLNDIGYDRTVTLEVMNPVLWKRKPSQVMELGFAALKRTLTTRQP